MKTMFSVCREEWDILSVKQRALYNHEVGALRIIHYPAVPRAEEGLNPVNVYPDRDQSEA